MTKKGLYILSVAGCIAGYIWLAVSWVYPKQGIWLGCLFKQIFHIPCPACGSTRALTTLLQGNLKESLVLNPNGFLLAILMISIPVWVCIDKFLGKETYYSFYKSVDRLLGNKGLFFLLTCLVLLNWFWNIHKGL